MKLLLDQGTPRSAATILRRDGFDAVHTGETGLAGAEDSEIIRQAALDDRVVVTFDSDFHMLLALEQALKPSVIRIRIEGLRAEEPKDSDWRCRIDLLEKVSSAGKATLLFCALGPGPGNMRFWLRIAQMACFGVHLDRSS